MADKLYSNLTKLKRTKIIKFKQSDVKEEIMVETRVLACGCGLFIVGEGKGGLAVEGRTADMLLGTLHVPVCSHGCTCSRRRIPTTRVQWVWFCGYHTEGRGRGQPGVVHQPSEARRSTKFNFEEC